MSIKDKLREKVALAQIEVVERMDTVINAMTGLGGSRDKGNQVGVDVNRVPLNDNEKDTLGRFDGYAVSWFERLSNEATLTGWDVKVGNDVQQQMRKHERRLGVARAIRRGLHGGVKDGGSLILMVTDQKNLKKPLDLKKIKKLHALHVFDACEFQVHEWETDLREPNWRKAKTWQIMPQVNGSATTKSKGGDIHTLGQEVHRSHCVYIPGRELSDRLRGLNQGKDDSYLDSAWDAIKDMLSIDQGGAVLAQEMKQDVIKMGGLEAVDAGALGEVMRDRMKTIVAGKGLLNMIVLAEDDNYETRAATTQGYKDLKAGGKSTFAAVSNQPETVAFGATPGGLNTDGEAGRRFWDRVVAAVQKTHLLPGLERIYEVIIATMAEPISDWRIEFRPLGTLTPVEQAEVHNKNAQTDRIYQAIGVLPPKHIAKSRFGDDGYQDILPVTGSEMVPNDPSRAFTGPQGDGVAKIIAAVAAKLTPRESGVAQMIHLYNVTPAAAEAMMDAVGTSFFAEPPEVQAAAIQVEASEKAAAAAAEATEKAAAAAPTPVAAPAPGAKGGKPAAGKT